MLTKARRVLACYDVLKVAHEDAQRVYQELSGYRITLALEPNGWHVDYDLAAPFMAGGGPHYVIDSTTGTIITKRYEQ